ncbi:MAG: hypothetical protein HFI39_06155 [Lachnospiraceae bacterium]|nr:hypothetical protein [Lachnospiraceae bacterium]
MKKFNKSVAWLLVVLMLALTACGGGGDTGSGTQAAGGNDTAGGSTEGTSVIIGQSSEVANLNPMIQPRTPDSNVQCMIFSFLVIPDEELNYVGDLADNWDISEDGTVYTFHLKEGVKWHDGEDFNADDVVFTLTSLAHPNYNGGNDGRVMSIVGAADYQAGTADSVSGIKKVDDHTVEITLISPNAAFLSNMYTSILPEHILAGEDPGTWGQNDFNRAPVGTGKYKFVEWKAGQYISLVRNEDYYGQKPSIQNVTVQFGADTTLVAALLNGEIDVLYNLAASEVENVEAMDGVSAYNYEQMTVTYIGLNQLVESLSDVRVRQALSYGIDKEALIGTVYGEGKAYICDDVFPSNHWSHSENVTKYEYNPEKAKSLLEEAGYTMNASTGIYEKDGVPLHLTYDMSTSTDGRSIAALIQQQWKEIGVDMEVIEQDFAVLAYEKLLPGEASEETTAESFQCYTLGFGVEADPEEYNEYFSTSTGAGSWNFIHYSNPQVDALFKEQLLLSDPAERAECFHQIADLISQDIPWIPLYNRAGIAGLSDRVQNFVCDYRGITFQIEKWTVAE